MTQHASTMLRPDLQAIADMVGEGASLLDVGCGEGDLLAYLQERKNVSGRGIELSQSGVNRCISRGLSVIQGDADIDLAYYPDQAYDYVVLSQTLQTLRQPKETLAHLVRIARHAIVSVPNFGHWKNRLYLVLHGRMPVTRTLSYAWYDTPNIHFCTITDFIRLCAELNLTVERQLYVTEQGHASAIHKLDFMSNLLGQQGIFMIRA
jgi:methionine biosynthesis protein MetW